MTGSPMNLALASSIKPAHPARQHQRL